MWLEVTQCSCSLQKITGDIKSFFFQETIKLTFLSKEMWIYEFHFNLRIIPTVYCARQYWNEAYQETQSSIYSDENLILCAFFFNGIKVEKHCCCNYGYHCKHRAKEPDGWNENNIDVREILKVCHLKWSTKVVCCQTIYEN